MEVDNSWLENVLKRKSFEESPVRILEFERKEGAIQKGENYMSQIVKIKAKVLLASGKTKKMGFIVKDQHRTEFMKKLSSDSGVFLREITVYRHILPKMDELLDEISDTDCRPWGCCVDVKQYSQLTLEDLTYSGFKVMDRRKQLGLNAVLLVMRELGKFHALSKILLDRGEVPLDIYGKHLWHKEEPNMQPLIEGHIEKLGALFDKWGGEWTSIKERMKNSIPNFSEAFFKAMNFEAGEFGVLNHGDDWTNNMLFKYSEDPENPSAVKFIDFQLAFLSTPARDLAYFLNSSARPSVVEEHYDKILSTYCASLKKYLTLLNYEGFIPGLDDLKEMLRKREILPLAESFMVLPFILSDFSQAPDVEDMFKSLMEEDENKKPVSWNHLEHISIEAETAIKVVFKRAIANGLIK